MGLNKDYNQRLKELLEGRAMAPPLSRGEVPKERVESVALRQCDACERFESTAWPLKEEEGKLFCSECYDKLWFCPQCDLIKPKPERDYLCEACRYGETD